MGVESDKNTLIKFYYDEHLVYECEASYTEEQTGTKIDCRISAKRASKSFGTTFIEIYRFNQRIYWYKLNEPKYVSKGHDKIDLGFTRPLNSLKFIMED